MKYYKLFLLLAIIGIVLIYAYPRVAAHAATPIVSLNTGKWEVMKLPTIPPLLARIGHCESPQGQFSGGKVVTHQNTNGTYDIGTYQINSLHINEANHLGWNLFTAEGNALYAFYLYQREGTTPWLSSEYCWG